MDADTAAMGGEVTIRVQWRGAAHDVVCGGSQTLGWLWERIGEAFPDADVPRARILGIRKGRALLPEHELSLPLSALVAPSGRGTVKAMLMGPQKDEGGALRREAAAAGAERMPPPEHETRREEARLRATLRGGAPGNPSRGTDDRFGGYSAWEPTALALSPRPTEAERLLRSLARDPGIVGVMRTRGWRVGKLTEMPPEGFVGISPVCVLGLNINKGQEIQLRLRTDDLKGFRKREVLIEVLVHELAHIVFSEHDGNFKALNSELLREVRAIHGGAARVGAGAGTLQRALDALEADVPPSWQTVAAAESGKKLKDIGAAGGPKRRSADSSLDSERTEASA
ncbi:unnamed protein product [Pedinophyceae sp. YPF-701]|nr:unnamed protein product [Pedinophyceae sp. YPF-701]